ncbi:Translation initiation factor eIF-2B subunit alpha [Cricetulus griseus]|uniref:Translation initiation factor eIF-2B subunit alpha n=1 Tax=Cricetulus griseus TaxID=10029 RepID=G3HX42_CRIGR|nr:Translation initiation factor eIF-2B subunit alpha [Cricetulus griseus]
MLRVPVRATLTVSSHGAPKPRRKAAHGSTRARQLPALVSDVSLKLAATEMMREERDTLSTCGLLPARLRAAGGSDGGPRKKMAKALCHLNVPVTVVLDAAVGYIMEKADLVIVGAEGVVENGGIINKIGTNQMAVCAKAQNKPFYVVAESFKFVRLFPLNQQDVPDKFKYKADTLKSKQTGQDLKEEHPWVDYTSPSLITLLFTDLGVLTPSAVSDELIKLYL